LNLPPQCGRHRHGNDAGVGRFPDDIMISPVLMLMVGSAEIG
jgi:hypothetical protein